jgi:hypothetical protein
MLFHKRYVCVCVCVILFKCSYLVYCPEISTLSLHYCSNYNFVGSILDVSTEQSLSVNFAFQTNIL